MAAKWLLLASLHFLCGGLVHAGHSYTFSPGTLAAGNDLQYGTHTLPEAFSICSNLVNCSGFTYNSTEKNLNSSANFYFKSATEIDSDGSWSTYLRGQPPKIAPMCPSVKLVWLADWKQINASSFPNASKYGVEDGIVVRRADGGFSMIGAEMYDDPRWVSMRLGVYFSPDAINWSRRHALRTSSAIFNGSDQHAASWGPFFLHDAKKNTWVLSYVGYRSAPSNSSGWLENFEGTIFARWATTAGDAGLDSLFGDTAGANSSGAAFADDKVLIRPDDFNVKGPWPHQCQGLQGTDSFYPYQLNDGSWAALAGTSNQQSPNTHTGGKWPVSLATALELHGPWTRYNPLNKSAAADAPCVDINGGFTENPIVSRRPDDPLKFHAVYDDLSAESVGFGYTCSDDGLRWSKGTRVLMPNGTRTPFGLLPLTAAELAARKADVLSYGVLNESSFGAANTSLQWAFYTTRSVAGSRWEGFRASIVQLSW
jgi:hypothetical protein